MNKLTKNKILSQINISLINLKQKGFLVGGAVRSILLEKTIKDIDIIVSNSSKKFSEYFANNFNGKVIELDKKRKIYRIIVKTKNKTYEIDVSPIKKDIITDLKRRDFTIDSIAIDLIKNYTISGTKKYIDPYNGIKDLNNKILRSNNSIIFIEDPIRLLRDIRISSHPAHPVVREGKRSNCKWCRWELKCIGSTPLVMIFFNLFPQRKILYQTLHEIFFRLICYCRERKHLPSE